MMDAVTLRRDFPIFQKHKPFVYLDSAATTLKPRPVLHALQEYYETYSANVYRGIYAIAEQATAAYEQAREKVAAFIDAPDARDVIFTRGTTESLNLLAYSWGRMSIGKGDEIAVTIMEHHSNFVPWQQLVFENSATLKVWNVDKNGKLDLHDLRTLITRKTKLLAITAASNVLGTIVPIKEIIRETKRRNPKCLVFVDAAQAIPHMPVSVADWGADAVAFSAHKMLGPTGIGALWATHEFLDALVPFHFGGEMIREVYLDRTIFKEPPHKFEAGTPHIAGVIGFGAAADYLTKLGMENVRMHEKDITTYALSRLSTISGVTFYGPTSAIDRGSVIAFSVSGIHPHDVAQVLDGVGVCVRAGNHCAMPIHTHLGVAATTRASFSVYTTREDIDALVDGLKKVKRLLL